MHCLLGDITITSGVVDSDLNGTNPQFTLTCISIGGPATNVTWARDSVTVTEGTETVLDDPVTAQYTHTLIVTERQGGLYTCTVANNKPSSDSASYTVQGNNIIILYMCICDHMTQVCLLPNYTVPTISLTSFPSSSIIAGNTVTLNCSVTLPDGVTGTVHFYWEDPNGIILAQNDSISRGQIVSSGITLNEIRTSQAGLYNCTATHDHSGTFTATIIILVQSQL